MADSEVRQKFDDFYEEAYAGELKSIIDRQAAWKFYKQGMRAGEIARWIPVEEKLPRPQQFVLAFYSEDDMEVTWYTGEVWSGGVSKPTHWQPLPAAPEEKK